MTVERQKMASKWILKFVLVVIFSQGSLGVFETITMKFNDWMAVPLRVDEDPMFVYAASDYNLNVDLYSYHDDPRIMLMFDKHGNIAGIRHGIIKADVSNKAKSKNLTFPYDFDAYVGSFLFDLVYWDTEVWCADILFVSPDVLQAGGRDRLGLYPVDDVYMFLDGFYTKIPSQEKDVEAAHFVKQGCYDRMGTHYFYKIHESEDCRELASPMVMFVNGSITSCSIVFTGSTTNKTRSWYDALPLSVAEAVMVDAPSCIVEWIKDFGLIFMHIFFVRDPDTLVCPGGNNTVNKN